MIFSSTLFLVYFLPIFLVAYHLSPRFLKNTVILLASIFFYSWGAPKFVFVILVSTILDFYLVRWMHHTRAIAKKKTLLGLSIFLNLGLLVFFKYANFFVENFNLFLNQLGVEQVGWTEIALPIGISFYTFQTLTYSIDVYRKTHEPLKRVDNYLLYIMSFPQMIAGPIVRFNAIADQIVNRKEKVDDKLYGFYRFCIGLGKKVLIANVMGEQADLILGGNISDISTPTAWLGSLAYTFQIYFDFSGYSDMAIGLGRMMGFTFPENFNAPYISRSISEFWRRWHITLGAWMRDYLYIPLGGSKVQTTRRLYFNLWFVFLVSGLWHGAAWNFVLWGAYHGVFLILDRLFLLRFYERIGAWPSRIITFVIVMVGWVIFRLESASEFIPYLEKLFAFDFGGRQFEMIPSFYFILTLAIGFSFLPGFKIGERIMSFVFDKTEHSNVGVLGFSTLGVVLFILSLSSIVATGFNPFIYFRF